MVCSICFTLFTSKHTKVQSILIIWRTRSSNLPITIRKKTDFFPLRARAVHAHLTGWSCGERAWGRGLKTAESHLVQMCLLSLVQRQQRKDPSIQWLSINHQKEGPANIFTLVIILSSLLYGIERQVGILKTYWNHNIPFK